MHQRIPVAVHIVTALLLVYTILLNFNAPLELTGVLFFVSPFFMVWMVISIIKSKSAAKQLDEKDEWGYADKSKDKLGTF
jgi:hypothetical protein